MFLSSEADNHQTLDGDNDKQLRVVRMKIVSKYDFFGRSLQTQVQMIVTRTVMVTQSKYEAFLARRRLYVD